MTEFFGFRKMITPVIIQILFWVGVAVSAMSGIGLMIAGAAASTEAGRYGGGGGLPGGLLVFAGLLQIVLGPIFVRIYCELLILFFRIYETLTEIRDESRGRVSASAYPQPNPAFTHP